MLMNLILGLSSLMLMQEAEGQTSSGGSAGEGSATPRKRAPKTNLLDIQRGRLPLALVYCVRFVEAADVSNNDLAKKYGTSVGKIFDIRKGRNFTYVTKDYKVTDEDFKAAEAWAAGAAKHGGDEAAIMAAVDKIEKATADEAKAQAEKITAQRSKGPRQPKAKTEGGEKAGAPGNAQDLLK